ncbi:BamA/TamA family outer membrane protein, partial [Synechococcus sp. CCAP 1479/13]|uniref:BamA/TamA family outer membrane protein n=1 Tax=Synechococcus sp. CCAP 1479/13 TaxID=1221595 RepID=UPI001C242F02
PACPVPPAARDDRPGKPSLGPAPTPSASTEPRVLISEVVIEGLADHPERERLELAAYAAMAVTPGNAITRSELETDLQAIYATGWFSDVRIQPQDGPLGVRLVVSVVPNPVLTKVSLDPADAKVPETVVQDTFASDYGKTLNLVTLQGRMQELQKWYADQGFSLARVTGPSRIGPDGDVQLLVRQGTVKGVEVQFLNKEGSATNDKGQPIKGKTKEWVITREISIKTGEIFNRRNLEDDLKRLYGTGLFSDVKVTLRPEPEDPGSVVIVLGVVEQSTGSLSGGLGYSQSQGVFGQIQVQDSNLFGRAWDLSTSFTYGQFGGLADISFSDPWIKGDKYRTAFRFKAFVSRDAPQVFQSQNNGNFFTVSDFYQAPGTQVAYNIFSPFNPLLDVFPSVTAARIAAETSGQNLSWFQFDGNSVLIQRVGANVQFVRPLNGGNPFKRAPWTVLLGLTGQVATPMDFSGTSRRFALATPNEATSLLAAPTSSFICLAYNCAARNQLVGLRLAATMSTLNDPRNPTQGNFLSIGTEQFFSVGPDSPTFNRIRGSFTHYIPVRWLKFYKGCRPKAGETEDCKQALAFQVSAGTVIGDLPPYEAFCLGGGNSVRGYFDCDLGVGRSFGEATIEYRFPLFSIVSGELFIDGGTTFGSQTKVPGNLGGLLNKPGSGFSIGTGLIVTTPVGPLRLEVASQDFTGEWRFNLGVGWKF